MVVRHFAIQKLNLSVCYSDAIQKQNIWLDKLVTKTNCSTLLQKKLWKLSCVNSFKNFLLFQIFWEQYFTVVWNVVVVPPPVNKIANLSLGTKNVVHVIHEIV